MVRGESGLQEENTTFSTQLSWLAISFGHAVNRYFSGTENIL